MTKEKLCFIDVETTGLSSTKNFVHQIAIIIVIDGEIVEEVEFKIKPPRGTIINKHALAVSGTTIEMLEGYPDHSIAYKEITEILGKYVNKFNKEDKFHFAGYNAHFDNRFVRAFFTANDDNYFGSWFWSNNLDVMVLAGQHLKEERKTMKNFKLTTVVEHMGIEVEGDAHQAGYDIRITYELYKRLTNAK